MIKELAPEAGRLRAGGEEEELRYERKFLITEASFSEVESVIKRNPALFREIYHERAINNIYLDTPARRYYFENVDGFTNRRKARIRWYGELRGPVSKPTLEFKIKDGLLGRKEAHALPSFTVDEKLTRADVARLIEAAHLEEHALAELRFLEPALINRYRRKYYLSADRLYRLTIDFDLQFYNVHSWGNEFLSRSLHPGRIVLELKYGQSNPQEAARIASALPFRLTRMSKYVLGLDCLDGV